METTLRKVHVDATGGSDGAESREHRRLANLRPFQKGVSGNPSGTSKAIAELRALARAHTATAISKIIELVHSSDERVALMASKEVLDRGWGRPGPSDDGGGGRAVVVNILPVGAPLDLAGPNQSDE